MRLLNYKKNMLKISESRKKPPILQALIDKFNVDWDKGLLIAWEGKIHSKEPVQQAQKIVHEATHIREQNRIGNEAWWRLYLEDDTFRFEQEVMAHKEEARFIRENITNREAAFQMIRPIAKSLCSPMYGFNITSEEAFRLIK